MCVTRKELTEARDAALELVSVAYQFLRLCYGIYSFPSLTPLGDAEQRAAESLIAAKNLHERLKAALSGSVLDTLLEATASPEGYPVILRIGSESHYSTCHEAALNLGQKLRNGVNMMFRHVRYGDFDLYPGIAAPPPNATEKEWNEYQKALDRHSSKKALPQWAANVVGVSPQPAPEEWHEDAREKYLRKLAEPFTRFDASPSESISAGIKSEWAKAVSLLGRKLDAAFPVLNELEESIITALGTKRLKGQAIADKCRRDYNSTFKDALAGLRRRGIFEPYDGHPGYKIPENYLFILEKSSDLV